MITDTFDVSFIKYNPKLADLVGRSASMFIGALQFFLNNQKLGIEREGRKWVYNTSDQWAQHLKYSSRQIERTISKLNKQGIIIVKKLSRCKANRTNYYTIDEAKLAALLQEIEELAVITDKNYPKTLEESTSEIVTFIDKKTETSRHEGGFTTKKTNKDKINNKSEEDKSSQPKARESKLDICSIKDDQVHPIINKKLNEIDKKAEESPKSSPKTTVAQDMLAIWNKTLEKSKTSMSKQLAPLLVAAYKHKFDSDMEKWEHYCQTIASSPYLTGDKFTLSLLWALKYTIIERIHNHEFGVKELPLTPSYSEEQALEHLKNVNEPHECREVRLKLLKVYGAMVYRNWFHDLEFLLMEGKVCFKPQNKFREDYIKTHFSQILGGA